MKTTFDVVIIGGGIQGLSLAYHLTRLGVTGVCLVEAHTLGSGSSGRSATIIGHGFPAEEDLALTRLSFAAIEPLPGQSWTPTPATSRLAACCWPAPTRRPACAVATPCCSGWVWTAPCWPATTSCA